MHSEVKMLTL